MYNLNTFLSFLCKFDRRRSSWGGRFIDVFDLFGDPVLSLNILVLIKFFSSCCATLLKRHVLKIYQFARETDCSNLWLKAAASIQLHHLHFYPPLKQNLCLSFSFTSIMNFLFSFPSVPNFLVRAIQLFISDAGLGSEKV